MASEGWVKLYRNIQEHWIWQDPIKLKWWLDILLLANHKDNKFLLGNSLMEVGRGEFHTSELKLAERWKVSKKTVRSFLKLLENDNMISLKKSKKGTTIKVSNYNAFQAKNETQGTTEDTTQEPPSTPHRNHDGTIEEPLRNHEGYTNKNDKEYIKNDKEGEEGKETATFPPALSTHQILIKEQFGDVTYKTWFSTAEIVEDETRVNIKVPNEFNRTAIITKYKSSLENLFNKRIDIELG